MDPQPEIGNEMGYNRDPGPGIRNPGMGLRPGWDQDRDEFSIISRIRDGTEMTFGEPGWDRNTPGNPGQPGFIYIAKNFIKINL